MWQCRVCTSVRLDRRQEQRAVALRLDHQRRIALPALSVDSLKLRSRATVLVDHRGARAYEAPHNSSSHAKLYSGQAVRKTPLTPPLSRSELSQLQILPNRTSSLQYTRVLCQPEC